MEIICLVTYSIKIIPFFNLSVNTQYNILCFKKKLYKYFIFVQITLNKEI